MRRAVLAISTLTLALVASTDALAQDTDSTATPSLLDQLESADGGPSGAPAMLQDDSDDADAEGDDAEGEDSEGEEEFQDGTPPPVEPPSDEDEESDDRDDARPDKGESPKWNLGKPSARPAVSAVLYSDGASTGALLGVGASVRLPFNQMVEKGPYWGGYTRAVGQVFLGPDFYNGYAVRVGAFAGPRLGPLRLDVGPDFFYDTYVYSGVTLDPVAGVGIPATGYIDFQKLMFYGGVEPSFYFSDVRDSVDWGSEDMFGFGDEFTYRVGTAINVDKLGLSIGYSHRITAYGPQRGVSFGIRL
jgi:hypothetical protein